MSQSSLFTCILLVFANVAFCQFTETINSNRPGQSQGAFSVGKNIIQLESGIKYGKDDHELLNFENDLIGVDFAARFGLLKEQLEISLIGNYTSIDGEFKNGTMQTFGFSNFERVTLGAKYLLYDPYKNGPDKPNLYSWKANRAFKWKSLIPAVALYAGANFNFDEENPFAVPNEGEVTPRIELITQHVWSGGWVLVMNFIGDKITTDFPTYGGLFTLTHSFAEKFAAFGEYQVFKSDIYSDNIGRAGLAYLIGKNLQVDISGLVNFKDTPSRWQVGAGISYRINSRTESDDVILNNERR